MSRCEKTPQRGSRHTAFFSEWVDSTPAQTSARSFGVFGSRAHLRSLLTLMSTLPSAVDQPPSQKLVIYSCSGRYHCSIPTSLLTMIVHFVEQGMTPSKSPAYRSKIKRGSELGRSASGAFTATVGLETAILRRHDKCSASLLLTCRTSLCAA
ncbi:hypothetical protein MRX96_049949 [Rhipicephalus microplus]